jgi:hypothetical protein
MVRTDDLPGATAPDLHGWKDIATFLKKSVRAVQRWERDFGLPVHRIKTPTGQVVYAFTSEIDSWRAAMDPQPLAESAFIDAEAPAAPKRRNPDAVAPLAADESPDGEPRTLTANDGHPRRVAVISLTIAVAMILLVGGLLIRRVTAVLPQIDQIVLSGDSLRAHSKDGRTIWSHRLGWTPGELKHRNPEGHLRYIHADIDGDRSKETFVVIQAPADHGEQWKETIYCFSSTGQLRWSYTPTLTLSFGGRAYEGPWRNYALIASDQPGRQRVWASYGHHTWWPSFVVELDGQGRVVPKYFQAGAVYTLSHWSTEGRNYLVASGVTNAYGRASVAVLDVDGLAATSPQEDVGADFRCEACPAQGPAFFALLPRTEINELAPVAYNRISTVRTLGTDCVLDTVEDPQGPGAGAVYYLRSDFTFHDAALNDAYWKSHRRLEREGKIVHAAAACPDARRVHNIRSWRPNVGWSDLPCRFRGGIPGQ